MKTMTCPPGDPLLRGCLNRRSQETSLEDMRLIYKAAASWLAERLAAKTAGREFHDADLPKASAA
jgi:hypothetical protein